MYLRRHKTHVRTLVAVLLGALALRASVADDLLYRYEGNVVPYDESAGWILADPCDTPCTESVEDGHFILRWPWAGNLANYHLWIARRDDPPPPPTLWVEWRFRSNHPLGPYFHSCDGEFFVSYGGVSEYVSIYGDAAISSSAADFVLGLDIDEFHSYRFESLDGISYTVAVDGLTFITLSWDSPPRSHYLQFSGRGGCASDQIPDMVNEWDHVRYGTISYGEQIVTSDPPTGFLDARTHAGVDCFAVTFDSPNYAYIDEITVDVTGPPNADRLPQVTQTRRRDNDEPDTVEIILDRPIARGESTRFTFDDGIAVNVIEYTFAPGDTDGDGDADLRDIAASQRCFGLISPTGPCWALDLDESELIDHTDHAALVSSLTGP